MRHIELFTIGHSNHSSEQFLDLLRQHEIEALVDIRRFPSSRTFPHFNRDNLSNELAANDIEYTWIESLGGRRPKAKDFVSPNTGLRNESFRNYADYMMTDEFRIGMNKLSEIAGAKRTAIMCAESVFWRCHRRLVSDFVLANGGAVQHIFPSGESKTHSFTKEAKVENGKLSYPEELPLFDALG
jgi:uncharacterized protein (DUF488 family)